MPEVVQEGPRTLAKDNAAKNAIQRVPLALPVPQWGEP